MQVGLETSLEGWVAQLLLVATTLTAHLTSCCIGCDLGQVIVTS